MAEIAQSGGSGKGNGKVRSKKTSTKVDMTPMVDLGFLLITFFMFTTTFSKPNVMKLNMPEKDDKEVKQPETQDIKESNTISIIMGKDNRVFWHQKSAKNLTPDLLKEADYSSGENSIRAAIMFAAKNALSPDKFTVVIKPNDDCNYKNTVDILDEMEITKSERYAIVDITKEEKAIYNQKVAQPK